MRIDQSLNFTKSIVYSSSLVNIGSLQGHWIHPGRRQGRQQPFAIQQTAAAVPTTDKICEECSIRFGTFQIMWPYLIETKREVAAKASENRQEQISNNFSNINEILPYQHLKTMNNTKANSLQSCQILKVPYSGHNSGLILVWPGTEPVRNQSRDKIRETALYSLERPLQ